MLPFGVTNPATVSQRSEIPEGLTNYPTYLACFLMTFEMVRVTPKRNGSVTVINSAENTKKWKEMDNNSAETRATLLANTIRDHHRRVPCYTSKRMVN
jgi:hypothetical protein